MFPRAVSQHVTMEIWFSISAVFTMMILQEVVAMLNAKIKARAGVTDNVLNIIWFGFKAVLTVTLGMVVVGFPAVFIFWFDPSWEIFASLAALLGAYYLWFTQSPFPLLDIDVNFNRLISVGWAIDALIIMASLMQ